jgi:hypothetical protein
VLREEEGGVGWFARRIRQRWSTGSETPARLWRVVVERGAPTWGFQMEMKEGAREEEALRLA